MNTAHFQTETTSLRGLLQRTAALIASFAHALKARRERARATDELSRLDDAALRDLGISRSEFDSFRAEAAEEAEQTRQRLAILRAGGAAP